MHVITFFLLISLLFLSIVPLNSGSHVNELFESWCKQHGRTYTSEQEKQRRREVFEDNYAFVNQYNTGNSSFHLSLNAFADLTHHEFKASYLGFSPAAINLERRNVQPPPSYIGDVPASLDWRKGGAVTEVKDQGSCGACWSFAATGAIEGINKIVTGSIVSLSEQELIDCDTSYNSGCEGGLMEYAYQFVIDNHGIDTEKDYPYQSRDGKCNKAKLNRHVVTIDGYVDVPANKEELLVQAVAAQPVSVGICGSERAFQFYSSGIFTGPCSTSLDHAVLIVGYGSENGLDYWIVKNSWGRNWGMNGYIHVQRNTGKSQGLCGINMLASYPTKTSQNPPPPPSPPPGPAKCDLLTYCSAGETCCCARSFIICLSWKCCELNSAVCCKDHQHCCPSDYPICDTKKSRCLKLSTGNATLSEASKKKGSLKFGSWSSLVEGWFL